MAFSNSFDYTHSITAADIIALALRRLGVYDPDETVNPTEQTNALQVLNLVLKEWSHGVDIWGRDTMNLMLNVGAQASTNGKTVSVYTTNSSSNSYLLFGFTAITTLTADAVATATSLTVDSITGFSTTDYIFIKLADNSIHVTTVNGAPSGSTIVISTGLLGAAYSGAVVYGTPTVNRFLGTILQVQSAAALAPSDTAKTGAVQGGLLGTRTPIQVVGSDEYHAYAQADQTGMPQVLYHVRKPQYSEFHVHPRGVLPNVDSIEMVVIYPIMDVDSTTDNLYITPDAVNALAWDLAANLASEYGLSEGEQRRLWALAEAKKKEVFDFNIEDAPVIFTMDMGG